jgi:hypothetical protein
MAFSGARVSEVLALSASRIDAADEAIVFETLKQRKKESFPSSACASQLNSSSDGLRHR